MLVVFLLFAPALLAQSPASTNQNATSPAPSASAAEVPRLIKFSGTLLDVQDRPMAGPVGVTFALHAQQTGGAALWLETQNVKPDANGVYTVLLGANSANGVPAELFASGEARWLEVQVERQAEQPRVLLVSVPYALKAKDAETLGGKPASAFVTTETLAGAGNSAGAAAAAPSSSTASTAPPSTKAQTTTKKASSAPQPAVACTSVTSDGTATANSVAKFTAACNIQNSAITDTGGNVGIGTAAPAVALDILGNNAGLRLSGTGTHQVTVTGLSSGRLGQDANGFFFASDTNGKTVRFLTNNGTLNERMRITSAGSVGIGTTSPNSLSLLNVIGSAASPVAVFGQTGQAGGGALIGWSTNTGSTAVYGVNFGGGGVPGFDTFNIGVAGQSNNGIGVDGSVETGVAVRGRLGSAAGKLFSGLDPTSTEKFSVDSSGNVRANAYQDLAGNPISGNVTQILYSGATTATSSFTPSLLLTPGTFSKVSAATAITATWISHVSGGAGNGSAFCQFELRIDNTVPTGTTAGAGGAVTYAQHQAVTLIGRWTGLATGSHTVSIWLRGSGVSCTENLGNFERQVYVVEF